MAALLWWPARKSKADFISPNVLNFLVEQFHIAPITTPEADLAELLGE